MSEPLAKRPKESDGSEGSPAEAPDVKHQAPLKLGRVESVKELPQVPRLERDRPENKSAPGPGAALKAFPDLEFEQAKVMLTDMSSELNELINAKVEQIGEAAEAVVKASEPEEAAPEAGEEDEFIGLIGGPLEAPVSEAEIMVAKQVLGERSATSEVVRKARTVVASMIAGLIAYANNIGVLVPAVDAAAGVGAVGVEAAAGAASATFTILQGLLSMPSPLMAMARASGPVVGFLCHPNVLVLLPILFLGYSLGGAGGRGSLLRMIKDLRETIHDQLMSTYDVGIDVAEAIVSNAERFISLAGNNAITIIKEVTSLYLKLFATACTVVRSAQAAGEVVLSTPGNIANLFKSVKKSLSSGMGQVRARVGNFADRIRDATIRAAESVVCELRGQDAAVSMGGRKTRKRVGRRQRGKRGASTRKGKGKGKEHGKRQGKAAKRGGSTRKGKGRGKSKGKGRGSSTRRRHSRKH